MGRGWRLWRFPCFPVSLYSVPHDQYCYLTPLSSTRFIIFKRHLQLLRDLAFSTTFCSNSLIKIRTQSSILHHVSLSPRNGTELHRPAGPSRPNHCSAYSNAYIGHGSNSNASMDARRSHEEFWFRWLYELPRAQCNLVVNIANQRLSRCNCFRLGEKSFTDFCCRMFEYILTILIRREL